MDAVLRLSDLPDMHPELLWESIVAATAAVLGEGGREPPHSFALSAERVFGFGSEECALLIDPCGISALQIARACRTYEPSRRIELAAIAVAALGLHHAGGHEIVDLAVRGSGADYLVGQARYYLEIAGRSRRRDLEAAWHERWERLTQRWGSGFYLCVAEFDTCTARLACAPPKEEE